MRFYRALLFLYPASFRAEYGEEMMDLFRKSWERASGPLERLSLAASAIRDISSNALRAQLDVLGQDLRHSAASLARAPGFTLTAIAVAALGVGATTAAFSVTDHVMIRPLPFPDASRLVKLWEDQSYRDISRNELSPANYRDWKRLSTSFEGMGAYADRSMNLVGAGEPERLDGALATWDLFEVLRSRPLRGRLFTAADDAPGAPAVVVISSALWKRAFAGDPEILGRAITLNESPYTVIGVMPSEFLFPTRAIEFWVPFRFAERDFEDRTDTYLRVVAKLKAGVSLAQARADMTRVTDLLQRAYPKENERTGAAVIRMRDEVSWRTRLLLTALFGAAAGVLLIACTNLASLLLARAVARRRELAVRAALGAGRERLLRQLLTESLVLAAAGGVLGVLLALAAVPLITRLVPTSLPIAAAPAADLRVLAFAALVTFVTGIAFGVLPALRATGGADVSALRDGARTGSGRSTERLRSALVVTEVAASVALLVVAGLLIRALERLERVDPGFRPQGVLTLRTSLPLPRYEATERRAQFYERVLEDVRRLPGVSNAAFVSFLPMVMRGGIWPVNLEGEPDDPTAARLASLRFVTPGFFATLGIPLRRGRDVAVSDRRASPSVAVVSESFAHTAWPGQDPIGKRFRFALQQPTVVGVVGDVRVRGLESESEPQIYLAYRQVDDSQTIWYHPKDLVIRSSASPSALLPEIRRIVARADPQVPISDVRTLTDIVDAETGPRRVQLAVLGGFALCALVLAGIGIHGLLAFTVSQRSREIGIRIALGAQRPEILRMVVRQGMRLALGGTLAGAGIAYAAGRGMQALLFGVRPGDEATFLAAVIACLATALAGSLAPARRAVRLDPISAIRAD